MDSTVVLVVDDDPSFRRSLVDMLDRYVASVGEAGSLAEARQRLAAGNPPDVMLVDRGLPDGDGLELRLDEHFPVDAPLIAISRDGTTEAATKALQEGASDYLSKPLHPTHLRDVVLAVQRGVFQRREVGSLREHLKESGRFCRLVGRSGEMQAIYDLIARVAPSRASVLLTGESGTGKELVAQTIHELSRRSDRPFLALNCGAIPPTLIEAQLFGHVKGAFTGASDDKTGVFEQADGGTLLLDEIGEMPLELQVHLLRVLETGQVQRVGSSKSVATDVRVLASTNRNPQKAIAEGRLREDLYYRLSVFPIHLPPLRERGSDVVLIAAAVLDELNEREGRDKTCSRAAIQAMLGHSWPGNVRELKNAIERAWLLCEEELRAEDIRTDGRGGEAVAPAANARSSATTTDDEHDGSQPGRAPATGGDGVGQRDADGISVPLGATVAEAERRLILATLARCEGNKRKTARILGISVKTLYTRLRSYEEGSSPVA